MLLHKKVISPMPMNWLYRRVGSVTKRNSNHVLRARRGAVVEGRISVSLSMWRISINVVLRDCPTKWWAWFLLPSKPWMNKSLAFQRVGSKIRRDTQISTTMLYQFVCLFLFCFYYYKHLAAKTSGQEAAQASEHKRFTALAHDCRDKTNGQPNCKPDSPCWMAHHPLKFVHTAFLLCRRILVVLSLESFLFLSRYQNNT